MHCFSSNKRSSPPTIELCVFRSVQVRKIVALHVTWPSSSDHNPILVETMHPLATENYYLLPIVRKSAPKWTSRAETVNPTASNNLFLRLFSIKTMSGRKWVYSAIIDHYQQGVSPRAPTPRKCMSWMVDLRGRNLFCWNLILHVCYLPIQGHKIPASRNTVTGTCAKMKPESRCERFQTKENVPYTSLPECVWMLGYSRL